MNIIGCLEELLKKDNRRMNENQDELNDKQKFEVINFIYNFIYLTHIVHIRSIEIFDSLWHWIEMRNFVDSF